MTEQINYQATEQEFQQLQVEKREQQISGQRRRKLAEAMLHQQIIDCERRLSEQRRALTEHINYQATGQEFQRLQVEEREQQLPENQIGTYGSLKRQLAEQVERLRQVEERLGRPFEYRIRPFGENIERQVTEGERKRPLVENFHAVEIPRRRRRVENPEDADQNVLSDMRSLESQTRAADDGK